MNIADMHTYFRQYAQQMGMQNVRAILPEQIDLLINTSISDTVNKIIQENIGITSDRIISDNSKIGQINALRTLYVVDEIPFLKQENTTYIFTVNEDSIYPGLVKATNLVPNFLFLVDFSLNYKKVSQGISLTDGLSTVTYVEGELGFTSNYFPVRLIDDAYLSDTLNDFILKPRLRSPILTVYNDNVYDFYIDSFVKKGSYYEFKEGLLPYKVRCSYVKKPAKVVYGADLGVQPTNCDLPEYLHVDIVKHAVDLYRVAVTGSPMIGQARNQENTQNNQS